MGGVYQQANTGHMQALRSSNGSLLQCFEEALAVLREQHQSVLASSKVRDGEAQTRGGKRRAQGLAAERLPVPVPVPVPVFFDFVSRLCLRLFVVISVFHLVFPSVALLFFAFAFAHTSWPASTSSFFRFVSTPSLNPLPFTTHTVPDSQAAGAMQSSHFSHAGRQHQLSTGSTQPRPPPPPPKALLQLTATSLVLASSTESAKRFARCLTTFTSWTSVR